jgi:hypothetical protein
VTATRFAEPQPKQPEQNVTVPSPPSLVHAPEPKQPRRAPTQRAAPRPVAPLVSRRAMARVQRAAEEVPQAVRVEVERRLGTDLSGARVHRGSDSGEAARELQARAFTFDSEIHVPSHHGPLHAGAARSLVAHELVHVAQQRRLGGSLPSEDSPAGRALEAEALTVEAGVTGMPAPRSGPPAPASPGSALSVAPAPAAGESRTPPTRGGRPSPQRAAALAPEDPAPGTQQSLEELAESLYGHIRTRLRTELLVDRERAGLLTDVR